MNVRPEVGKAPSLDCYKSSSCLTNHYVRSVKRLVLAARMCLMIDTGQNSARQLGNDAMSPSLADKRCQQSNLNAADVWAAADYTSAAVHSIAFSAAMSLGICLAVVCQQFVSATLKRSIISLTRFVRYLHHLTEGGQFPCNKKKKKKRKKKKLLDHRCLIRIGQLLNSAAFPGSAGAWQDQKARVSRSATLRQMAAS